VVTTTTTLIGMLPIFGGLNFIVALKLTGLVLKVFYISILLGHFPDLCSTLEQIIQG
jgi:hypothetical protein